MNKSRQLLACLVLLLVLFLPAADLAWALPPLAAGTFPVGTIVVPMDGLQKDRIRVYGFIHEFLRARSDATFARVIEPPDVTMQTSLTPSGAVYQGGPFLIDQGFLATANSLLSTPDFNQVTITRLTTPFTSNHIFFVRQPTTILVIKGIWGRTDYTLTRMRINYTLVDPSVVENNPSIINNYSLVVVDCPGWFGDPSTFSPTQRAKIQTVYSTIKSHVQAGNEVIFTDIALLDLNATFPGYMQLQGGGAGTWPATIYNPPNPAGQFPAEFPSQYYNPGANPNSIMISTEGGGITAAAVAPAHTNDVRILIDSNRFGIPSHYAILGFYFQFGSGIVEGLAFHPQDQISSAVGDNGYYAVYEIYGDKFVHGPQLDFIVSATPSSATINQGDTATYQVTVTSIGGFSAPVNLQVTGVPSSSTPSLSPVTVTPSAGGTVSSTLTIATTYSTPNGTYQLKITGTSSLPAISHYTNVTLVVNFAKPDFAVDANPKLLILNQSQCGNISVSVQSSGAFNSPVNLTLSGLPAHTTAKYVPDPVTPPIGKTVYSTLTICAGPDAPPGNYTNLTVVGSAVAPSITHSVGLSLRILTPPSVNTLIYVIVLLLLLLALGLALLALFLSRKRGRPVARGRPRALYVLPLPTIRCRFCGRIMPLHAVYCPHCGRPQVVLVRPAPKVRVSPVMRPVSRKGIFGFILSLVAGILVILNSAALLAHGFWGPPTNWSAIFWWLPSLGQSYAFALGFIIGLVLIMGSLVLILGHGALADVIIFPFAVFSLIIGGGFIAGFVLGIVGGIIGVLKR